MASPFVTFGRPSADRFLSTPALAIVGTLPGYKAAEAYSNRLQVLNAVGTFTVEVLPGSSLPPGSTVWADNGPDEIVVEWPPYAPPSPLATDVKNGDLEAGAALMTLGAGWSVGTGGFPTTGTKTLQYDGWGQSTAQWPMEACAPGTVINGAIDVQQGASSTGSVGAAAYILFFDANRKQIAASPGQAIFSGSNSVWQTSSVSGTAPPGTAFAAMAGSATRKRQNKPLWIDNARWDLSYPTGTTLDDDYSLYLKVTDPAGRVAYWSGIISEHYIYLTSLPYTALAGPDSMTVEPFFVDASTKLGLITFDQPHEDSLTVAPFFVSALTKSLNWAHPQPAEDFLTVSPFFVSALTKNVMLSHVQPQEDNLTVAPVFVSASTKATLVNNTIPFEALTVSPFFVSASTS